MWMAFLIGWRTNMWYITGEVRRVDTHTTANPKEPRQISVTVYGPMVTLTSRKWIVHIPVPEELGIQSFITNGGQSAAQVGDHTVDVPYGPVGGG